MSRDSRQRREARRRAVGRTSRSHSASVNHEQHADAPTSAEVIALIERAAVLATVPRAAVPHIERLKLLATSAVDPAGLLVEQVIMRVQQAWEHGWQPSDLVHATRRRASVPAATWIARVVLVEAVSTQAWQRAAGLVRSARCIA